MGNDVVKANVKELFGNEIMGMFFLAHKVEKAE